MALSISSLYQTLLKPSQTPPKTLQLSTPSSSFCNPTLKIKPFYLNHQKLPTKITSSAKQQSGSSVKSNNKKRKKKSNSGDSKGFGVESLDLLEEKNGGFVEEREGGGKKSDVYVPLPLPKPPAGFVVDNQGRVLMVAPKRLATIVDPTNKLPLECMIRRVFTNSKGEDCMLLCPVDTPVQILKSTNIEGWSAVSDEEVETVLPTAAYALAKIHMHLVQSGFCYTARGGFAYSQENIFEFQSDDGENLDGVPAEGVEITCFHLDGSHYMIYTPSDPLLFVAAKDENGQLRIADDDLLDDPAVVSAIDEETEFNALVEEEAALLESMFGER
ncbi:hypothetical protein RND81_12G151900 [Saponaria officinalis]|uniref:Uncharacterized protein n=1 Tax=Saponaria officinalis TaxID=3572 RepID=A0AAW1HAV2_SAPOF